MLAFSLDPGEIFKKDRALPALLEIQLKEAKEMFEALDGARFGGLPRLYEAQGMPFPERWVQAHFLLENVEWFAVEYDPEQQLF